MCNYIGCPPHVDSWKTFQHRLAKQAILKGVPGEALAITGGGFHGEFLQVTIALIYIC